ncbi:hypothetical protein COEREDRAFT_83747 [Coemansia reversa NRRL 1564]|uniref:Integral membrane protein n=1 Tax=Coemansia reversa (strain ATCC 12441 / NRRL 1564) TaxID=763665 RepID=A0A2G5B230_COERN|nr:hypothetical protein COEREDRAFT_83747 [Coemansia reversa NRRL 1564]|eukprot:PIA13069.1 hypothetical protein COEREDRAFT_83747 [Coemansia reversa NRRL 1564]
MSAFSRQAAMLSAGMLVTGTANTLLTKLQDKQCVRNCDDPDTSNHEHFEQPVWQTLNMFYGEMLCLVLLYLVNWKRCSDIAASAPDGYEPLADESADTGSDNIAEDIPTTDALPVVTTSDVLSSPGPKPIGASANLWMWIPATCDLLGTTLMNVGLFFTSASVYQMLRGAVVIFSSLFSVVFLGHRLERFQVISLAMVVTGVTIVGMSHIISPPINAYEHLHAGTKVADHEALKAALGVALVLGAQVFTATQFVVEEKIIRRYNITPLRAVGLEGAFGALTIMAAVPVLHLAIGRSHPGGYFDAPEGFRQIVENPSIWQITIFTMLSIAMFNYFGLSVTRHLSATSRATIDTCRTLFIWMTSLALGWESFNWMQVAGFIILVYGTFIYNRVISLPF